MTQRTALLRIPIVLGLALGLFGSACAAEQASNDEGSASPTTQVPATTEAPSTFVEAPSPDDILDDQGNANPETSNTDSDLSPHDDGDAPVLLALETLRDAQAFRMTSTGGQTIHSSALGLNVDQEIDPHRPVTLIEVAPNGDSYLYLDLGPMLAPLAGGDRSTQAVVDQAHIEMWTTPEQIIIDATGYQGIADLNPSADLGPYAPGIGSIDLVRLEGLGGSDLVNALVGEGIADPTILAERLPASLEDIQQDSHDPNVFTATSSYAAIIEAQGTDVVTFTRSLAIGIAPSIGVSVDDLADFYQKLYEQANSDVVLTLGPQGSLESLRITTDLSNMFELLYSDDSGIDFGSSRSELAATRRLFADTVWIVETVATFEIDETIAVTPPEGDHEDRTELARTYFAELIAG